MGLFGELYMMGFGDLCNSSLEIISASTLQLPGLYEFNWIWALSLKLFKRNWVNLPDNWCCLSSKVSTATFIFLFFFPFLFILFYFICLSQKHRSLEFLQSWKVDFWTSRSCWLHDLLKTYYYYNCGNHFLWFVHKWGLGQWWVGLEKVSALT